MPDTSPQTFSVTMEVTVHNAATRDQAVASVEAALELVTDHQYGDGTVTVVESGETIN